MHTKRDEIIGFGFLAVIAGSVLMGFVSSWSYLWCILAYVVLVMPFASKTPNVGETANQKIAVIPDFVPRFVKTVPGSNVRLMVDEDNQKVAFVRGTDVRVYRFDQITSVEVEKNGSSVHKTNKGNMIGRAAVGGVLLGGVGLLLGGLTGSKRVEDRVRKIALKVYVSDFGTAVEEIVFFSLLNGALSDSHIVRSAAKELDDWHSRFLTMIRAGEVRQEAA